MNCWGKSTISDLKLCLRDTVIKNCMVEESTGGSGNSSSGSSRGRAISSGTKVTGSRQALHPLPLNIAGQPGCKQRIYSTFHSIEATSELCLPPVSYERLYSILVLRRQRDQTA